MRSLTARVFEDDAADESQEMFLTADWDEAARAACDERIRRESARIRAAHLSRSRVTISRRQSLEDDDEDL
jgi:hypothetical protein